jgi:hypothetical protein
MMGCFVWAKRYQIKSVEILRTDWGTHLNLEHIENIIENLLGTQWEH